MLCNKLKELQETKRADTRKSYIFQVEVLV
jgi:hypothetical protein